MGDIRKKEIVISLKRKNETRKKKKKKLSLSLSPLFLPIIIIYLLTHLIHAGMRSTHSPYAVSTLALTLVR